MKRRNFLHQIGSILTILGITESEWLILGDRYSQALAQSNPRKLALLIGINQYTHSPALKGCLTDVELQKELLIERFGFLPSDILTLTEEQASREFIEAAFADHLGKQVKADDVVLFHFSGYGTRVHLGTIPDQVENALVPAVDQYSQNQSVVNFLLTQTLVLSLRSLPTKKVTAVLDTSYYAPSTELQQPSSASIRALPELVAAKLVAAEVEFLKQLNTQNLRNSDLVILSATSEPKQLARELLFSGFSAGLLTYTLTQYLWETTPPRKIEVILSHLGSSIYRLGGKQQPGLLNGNKEAGRGEMDLFAPDLKFPGAEGVITGIEEGGKTYQIWLAGLPPQVLENYGVNSRLQLITGEQLGLRSRNGLIAKAQLANTESITTLQVGQLVQEAVRDIPRNIRLTVALDPRLERIERVDATSAFAAFANVVSISAPDQPTDYVFSKIQQKPTRYGLLTVAGESILNTTGEAGEAAKVAVQRLAPRLSILLAAKFWRLTENGGSSRLPVRGSLEVITNLGSHLVVERETGRTLSTGKSLNGPTAAIPTVSVNHRLQYRVQNLSDFPVYLILVGLNNNRTAIAFYPWYLPQGPDNSGGKPVLQEVIIGPRANLTFPQTTSTSGWIITAPAEFCEHQLLLSTAPFRETMKALATAKYPTSDQQPIAALANSLEVAESLLLDLHNASAIKGETSSTATDSYLLDVNHWASLNFSFQVVA